MPKRNAHIINFRVAQLVFEMTGDENGTVAGKYGNEDILEFPHGTSRTLSIRALSSLSARMRPLRGATHLRETMRSRYA